MSNFNTDRSEDALKRASDAVRDVVDDKAKSASEAVGNISVAASDVIDKSAQAAQDFVDAGRETVADGLRKASSVLNDVETNATQTVKKYPLRVVAIAAAAGAVVGFAFGVWNGKDAK